MRKTIIGIGLALTACSKPAEEKKPDPAPAPASAPSQPAVEAAQPAVPPTAPPAEPAANAAEAKARFVAKLEEKMQLITTQTGELVEDLTRATSEADRELLKQKLEQLSDQKAALAQELEALKR